MYNQIFILINNQNLKKRYNIYNSKHWGLTDSEVAYFYFYIIIKSFLDESKLKKFNPSQISEMRVLYYNDWVTREILINNIKKNLQFTDFLPNFVLNKLSNNIWKKTCRVLFYLSSKKLIEISSFKYNITNININKNYEFNTSTYLKLNNSEYTSIYLQELLKFSFAPFSLLLNFKKEQFIIGASINTIFLLIKKARFQHVINPFSINNCLKLSHIPMILDVKKTTHPYLNKLIASELKQLTNSQYNDQIDILYIKYLEKTSLQNNLQNLKNNYEQNQIYIKNEFLQNEYYTFINLTFIHKSINLKLSKSVNNQLHLLKKNKELINKFLNILNLPLHNFNNPIISKLTNAWLDKDYNTFYINFLNFSVQMLYSDDILLKINKTRDDMLQIYIETNEVIQLKNKFASLDFLFNFETLRHINTPIYFNHFRDWRGRFYSNSLIHPMYNILVRSLLKIETPLIESTIVNSRHYNYVLKYKSNLNQIFIQKYTKLLLNDDLMLYFYIIYLSQIGNLLFSPTLQNYEISFKELISSAENFLFNNQINCDWLIPDDINNYFLNKIDHLNWKLEKKLYFFNLFLDFHTFITTNKIVNTTIIVDATASTLQCWSCVLPIQNNTILKNLNFSLESKTDSYSWIINLFKEKHSFELLQFKYHNLLLTRKNLKRTIMTINYNVTEWNSWNYFTEEINNSYPELFKNNIQIQFEAQKLHDLFYKFIKTDLFLQLFNSSRDEWLNNFIQFIDKQPINFLYFKEKINNRETAIRFNTQKKWKMFISELSIDIDWKKTKTALPANFIQSIDASIVDDATSNIITFPIHDCFIISIWDLNKLMDVTNSFFKTNIKLNHGLSFDYSLTLFI